MSRIRENVNEIHSLFDFHYSCRHSNNIYWAAVCCKNNKETRVLLGELAESLFIDTNLFIDNASKNSGKTANSILSAENTKCNAKSNPTEEKFDTIISAAIELKYFDAKYCECNLKTSQILKVIRPNSGLVKNFSPLFTNQ